MMMKILFLLAMILPAQAAELKILSWNTYMLPKPIKFSNQKIRTSVIARSLDGGDYDFIFMQEAFAGTFRKTVGNVLKKDFPHQYYLGNNKILYPYFGSGIFILGRHPFKVLDKVYFDKCGAADCYAAKGAVLIESRLPSGKTVQFASTHLQAKEKLGLVRLRQIGQIKELLKKHKKQGTPQFLIGDLNIDVTEPEFELGLDILEMKRTELTGPINHTNVIECYKKPGSEKEWIDHMLVDGDSLKDLSMVALQIEYENKGKTCIAADHYPLEGIFTFTD